MMSQPYTMFLPNRRFVVAIQLLKAGQEAMKYQHQVTVDQQGRAERES